MYPYVVRPLDRCCMVVRQAKLEERHVLLVAIIWAVLGIMLSLLTSQIDPNVYAIELGVSLS